MAPVAKIVEYIMWWSLKHLGMIWFVTTNCNDMICDCSLQLKVDMIKLIEVFGASEFRIFKCNCCW